MSDLISVNVIFRLPCEGMLLHVIVPLPNAGPATSADAGPATSAHAGPTTSADAGPTTSADQDTPLQEAVRSLTQNGKRSVFKFVLLEDFSEDYEDYEDSEEDATAIAAMFLSAYKKHAAKVKKNVRTASGTAGPLTTTSLGKDAVMATCAEEAANDEGMEACGACIVVLNVDPRW
jgi:hypothetical protein